MCAAEEGHLKITQLLVLHGASCGTRALTVANRHGHQSIAKCLEVIEGWPALKIAATCRLHAAMPAPSAPCSSEAASILQTVARYRHGILLRWVRVAYMHM